MFEPTSCHAEPLHDATARSPGMMPPDTQPPTTSVLPHGAAQTAWKPAPVPAPNVDQLEPSHMASHTELSIAPPVATPVKSPTATSRSFHTVAASTWLLSPSMLGDQASRTGAHVAPS